MSGYALVSLSLSISHSLCIMTLNYLDAMYNFTFGCAVLYEIKQQVQFPAGMNKVLSYIMLCYVYVSTA